MARALVELKAHCLAKPGAYEDTPWGEVVIKVAPKGKIFCFFGSKLITVKSTVDKQTSLIQHPQITVAAYVGRYGWVTVAIADAEMVELARDLIDESYELVAGKTKRPRS